MENNKSLLAFILEFEKLFGDVEWQSKEYVQSVLMNLIEAVSRDERYRKAMKSSEEEARKACEEAIEMVALNQVSDMLELYRQFKMNPKFKEYLIQNVEEESR